MQAKKSRRGHCLENKNVFHKSFELTKIRRFCIKWANASEHCATCARAAQVMAAGCVWAQSALSRTCPVPAGSDPAQLLPWLPWPGRVSQDGGAVLAPPSGTFSVLAHTGGTQEASWQGLGYVLPQSGHL